MKKLALLSVSIVFLWACSESPGGEAKLPAQESAASETPSGEQLSALALEVFKSPTCGCCQDWIAHLQENGVSVTAKNLDDVTVVKEKVGIEPEFQSCHTALTQSGYFFEGHVPAKFIQQFLQAPPQDAVGLSVPGMPMGSPGMEMGDRFQPYTIVQINRNGTVQPYARVNRYQDQF